MDPLEQHDTSLDLLTQAAADRVASRATAKGVEYTRAGDRITFPASAGVEMIPGAQGIVSVARDGLAIASVIEGEEIARR